MIISEKEEKIDKKSKLISAGTAVHHDEAVYTLSICDIWNNIDSKVLIKKVYLLKFGLKVLV